MSIASQFIRSIRGNIPRLLFKTEKPEDPKRYIGERVYIPVYQTLEDGTKRKIDQFPVIIESIQGNLQNPAFFEINHQHLIGMYRFYAQMNGAKDIPEEDFIQFEAIEHEVIKKQTGPIVGI